MKLKQIIQTVIVLGLVSLALFFMFSPNRVEFDPPTESDVNWAINVLRNSLPDPRFGYMDFLEERNHLLGQTPYFTDTLYLGNRRDPVSTILIANDDYDSAVILNGQEHVQFIVDVPASGLYSLAMEYMLPPNTFNPMILSLRVNDEIQYEEASSLVLPVFWKNEFGTNFSHNRFGDEVPPPQIKVQGFHRVDLFDASFISDRPLLFYLQAGENILDFRNGTSLPVTINSLTIYSERPLPIYRPPTRDTYPGLITINAIDLTHNNSQFVQTVGIRDPILEPFHPVDRLMNTIILDRAGNEAFFDIEIEQDGYYAISLHAITQQDDFSSFVTVRINGEIPFEEAASFPLAPFRDLRRRNHVLSDSNGEPMYFFLERGVNQISIRTELWPYAEQFRQLRLIVDHLNHLGLEIRRVTGREVDRNRTWRITRNIPMVDDFLAAYEILFKDMITSLQVHSMEGRHSGVANNMMTALTMLDRLRERPDELPLHLDMINGPDASVLQMAGVSFDALIAAGININNIYVGRSTDLPRERATWYTSLWAGTRNLLSTFTSDRFVVRNRDDALDVWVNHSFVHVDLIQRMIDTDFTPRTGIEVNISVMPDVGRLIMARAANTHPDVALGIPSHMPFEMGARGALYDFTQFDDFWEYMGNLVPGGLIPYIFNERVYAIPETTVFTATVYRRDILEPLGISPPDTWLDVATMQAELQRFDMSFFKPIASGIGYKWFFQTSPIIYQHGGLLFTPDGLSTAINQPRAVEAITFLGDLFTTFALAEQVPAFFNSFRFGQTPIGIAGATEYMLLKNAAPELLGQWGLAPFPGTLQDDGSISRWWIGNGVGSLIFDETGREKEAWEFLKWYLSADVQRDFAFQLFSNFNILWISSNIEALQDIPIDPEHREVFLDSLEWLRDVPRSPGQYMLERSLSDIWNTMVFEGTPAQVAIDLRVIDINREFTRKMIEFNFLDIQGNQIRPYVVRELDWVLDMIENARR